MKSPFNIEIPYPAISDAARFDQVLDRFDTLNAEDPREIIYQGETYPTEFLLAQALCFRILQLETRPSEALLLASRCQHLGRWKIPRSSYPESRGGYLKWRVDLKVVHAETAGAILTEAGYDEHLRSAVKALNLKSQLKENPDCQTLEDGLCLVFLQFQLQGILEKYPESNVVRILRKTARKMSTAGLAAAQELDYSPAGAAALAEALS